MGTMVYEPELLLRDGRMVRGAQFAVDGDGVLTLPPAGVTPVRWLGRAVFPGLVNAHSHAFQRILRGRTEFIAPGHHSDDFWSWREAMYQAATALGPDELYRVSKQAFLEMALGGVTSVGEFHYLHHGADGAPYDDPHELARQVVRAAREVGLRTVLLRVGYARSGFKLAPNPRQRRFVEPDVETYLLRTAELRGLLRGDALVTVGLAPHSVRAVPLDWLDAIAQQPRQIVHMHVCEHGAEVAACRAEYGQTPIALLDEVGLLSAHFTAVHAVHVAPDGVALLGRANATVCACPSTERNLGDGVVSADELVSAGVELALGTDSQVSIDMLDDARQLESHLRLWRQRRCVLDPAEGEPSGLARRLLRAASAGGARSLGLASGELAVGTPADLFSVDLNHPSLAGATDESLVAAMVFGGDKAAISEVMVQGRLIVAEGHHADGERTIREYGQTVRSLFS